MLKEHIKRLRLELEISQSELAKRAGYSHEFISQVERGVKSPSIKALKKIANGLNVCPSTLITSKQMAPETEESLRQQIQQSIMKLSVDELRTVRDLLSYIPQKDECKELKENSMSN